ncbi:MAG: PAS domain-containing protein [Tannerella sp.]|jgi:nitrogen fixation/metabolism regulation signal transduction histidine kinase|nr:PAS domain-containing protein [Tannerella sp.]
MKKKKFSYEFRLHVRIALTVLAAVATGCCLALRWYVPGLLCLVVLVSCCRRLCRFQQRTAVDMQRLIDAIHYSEFNISFKGFAGRGLAPELIPGMESAVALFNRKLQQREAEQTFYDMLLNRIDFGLLVTDRQNSVTWINKAALDVFGKPQPRKLTDLEQVSPGLPATLDRLMPGETKIIQIGQPGAVRQMAVTAIYFINSGRKLKLISFKNIQSVLDESESDAWRKLIRVLTHEIMNSLTPIISLSETFSEQNEENREMMNRAMQTIFRRSKGLVDFVSNYKKLTHIPQPVMTRFSAREWAGDISRLLKADGCEFTCRIEPEDLFMEADRGLMEQVLINLVRNACEASPPSQKAGVEVYVARHEYQRTLIRVTDRGEGILPEVMDRIFVPFFTTKSTGSGIGLSICRQIVLLHGGVISVQSEPEKGSCFQLII